MDAQNAALWCTGRRAHCGHRWGRYHRTLTCRARRMEEERAALRLLLQVRRRDLRGRLEERRGACDAVARAVCGDRCTRDDRWRDACRGVGAEDFNVKMANRGIDENGLASSVACKVEDSIGGVANGYEENLGSVS